MSWSFNIPFKVERGEMMEKITCESNLETDGACYAWLSSLNIPRPFVLVGGNSGQMGWDIVTSYRPFSFYVFTDRIMCTRKQGGACTSPSLSEAGTSAAIRIDAGSEFYVIRN